MQSGKVSSVEIESDLAVIAVVREGIKQLKGLGARLVNTLQRGGIEVKAISDGASETTIAILVPELSSDKALRLIHTACYNTLN